MCTHPALIFSKFGLNAWGNKAPILVAGNSEGGAQKQKKQYVFGPRVKTVKNSVTKKQSSAA